MADIPFTRLREGLDRGLLEGGASFSPMAAEAQRAVPPVHLVLNPADCTVTAGGESLVMKPRLFAFYPDALGARASEGRNVSTKRRGEITETRLGGFSMSAWSPVTSRPCGWLASNAHR